MKQFICIMLFITGFVCKANAEETIEFLPAKNLFNAPIADPRWPKFLMGISKDSKNGFGKNLWTFNFGENIGLIKFGSTEKPFEFGVQAASFGLMDIHSKPTKLINTDYFVAAGISYRNGNFQHLFQLSHVSSHIGDEYLLSTEGQRIERINLSYETAKWFLRYKNSSSFSPYTQIGYILHVDPSTVKRLTLAAGIDYLSDKIIFLDATKFIAGGFISSWEENKFQPTINIRAGLQYERTKYCGRYLQLLVEYKTGKSQHGQFYRRNINHIGLLVTFSS